VEVREEGGTPAIVESIRAGLAMKTKQTVIRVATTFLYFFQFWFYGSIPRKVKSPGVVSVFRESFKGNFI
jgi:hypothetical protein